MSLLDTEHKMGRGRGAWKECDDGNTGWAARRSKVSVLFSEIQSKQFSDLLNILNTLRVLCLFQMCKMP